ncbi:MAG TPA: diaminopimelate epimerase, partial [Chakrabartia sp.]|nr:diaminopimelate epimerase [Chakrabartia sp.]
FHKMHGLGNDFVLIDAREHPVEMTAARARAIADRRTGIGFDQLILIEPSDTADAKLRFFNADGSEVGACGNGTRAAALFISGDATLETDGGLLSATTANGLASVDMGQPRFDWDAIPLAYPMDTRALPLAWGELENPAAVNVGNPHAIFFVPETDAVPLDELGGGIEHDPVFPERVNVNVASISSPTHIRLRVWERGVGLTRACGTGACATAVAAIRAKLVQSPVTVSQPGGDLTISWAEGGPITMTGPATYLYAGETDWSRFG